MGPPGAMGPPAPPALALLLQAAAACDLLAAGAAVLRPRWARAPLALGVALQLGWSIWRGLLIGFLPLTSRTESYAAAALAVALVGVIAFRPARAYLWPLLAILAAAMGAALLLPQELHWPPPLMRTVWYLVHVPLSFLAYGTWVAAAAAGLAWFTDRDQAWLLILDRLGLWGFALWSLSMIGGGVWGVVAWGAWFLWDPKVVWSVILWFHASSFVHLRLTPSLADRPWARPALALVGLALVLVAYVGTSFLFGRSSHAFG